MVSIDVVYEGDLHCTARHGPSAAVLSTDAPADNRGRGESFSPTDLVAVALGTCMVTVMGIAAADRDWDLRGTRVRVEKRMSTAPRRIGALEVVISVPHDMDERQRAVLEKAALSCPVHASLHPEVDLPVRFEWAAPA